MKKTLLIICCLLAGLSINAQDTKVEIKSATASSTQPNNEASKAIDGDKGTIWHSTWSSATQFPVTFTVTLKEETHVDYVRYIPRQDNNSNGNWDVVYVAYCPTTTGNDFTTIGQFTLGGVSSQSDLWLTDEGVTCGKIKFTIESGSGQFASAAEIEVYAVDNSHRDMYAQYFTDAVFSELKPEVTSSQGIEDATLKALVDNLLSNKEEYKKFRVGEYEPYLSTTTLRDIILKVSSSYNNYENPTGVYLKAGESCVVAVSGISSKYPVGLKIKNWVENENSSSYSLRNGINQITASTEGNVFVNYYTDDFENAPNVKVHFINAPVQGYWDQATMTNEDWVKMLEGRSANDNTILITRSEHAQLAYPVSAWLQHCPTNVDSTMTLYQQVQWAERDILGLEKYGRQVKNRQLYYATTYGFMAAGGEDAYCNITSLGAIMVPDSKKFDFWGVGHEWGHNNQVTTGFKWSGCGETTNNIPASWAQFHFTGNCDAEGKPTYLRLEDETSGVDEYSGMRGGRMQTYFEEGLRKGVAWQLQDGPDYHGATPDTKTVPGINPDGYMTGSMVTTTTRNYDHFVKLVPFWQLNLWGTMAGKCPDIIPMVIESIRTTKNYTSHFNSNGKKQVNWMKLACDSTKINLLPFFEKAGMLRPINAYIEDYSPGWNIITEEMIAELKAYVEAQNYPAFTEEINYINGHNYRTYRDCLKLEVPEELNTGCKLNGNKVTIQHNQVKNAVAFETYNFKGELLRITMYGLGSNDNHSFTQVLYPKSSNVELNSAYIMAVGYDGERVKVFQEEEPEAIMKRVFLNLLSEAKEYQYKTDTTGTKIGYLIPDSIIGFTSFVNALDSLVEHTNEATHTYEKWYDELQTVINALNANTSTRVNLVPGGFYTFNVSNKEYQYIDNANAGLKTTENKTEETPENLQWRLVEASNKGTYYIQHRETGNYVSYVVSGKRVKAEANDIDEAVAFTLVAKLPGEFFIQCADDETIRLYNYGQNNQVYAGNQTGANAKWTILLKDDMLTLPD
ncbi:MAG: M60 family metallopeptidase, partial [Bacteroidaceae bacterium]|nr:M60 family metallopeptidase [Bacteroidaceae bacterium]